jgi:putative alpha-1,2-mannosidase
LSSPAFERAVVRVGGTRTLTIEASGASRAGTYVQSASLDGRPFARTWLPSQTLHSGGRLRFELGALPNRSWGTGPGAAPPSAGS